MLLLRGGAKGLADERRVEAPVTWLNDLLRTTRGAGPAAVRALGGDCARARRRARLLRTRASAGTCSRSDRTNGRRGSAASRHADEVVVYTLSAALAGFAGLLKFSKLSVGDPTVAIGLELDVIAAVIIGGGSLRADAAPSPARSSAPPS